MKRYAVIVEDSAQQDIQGSYDWGRRVWGKQLAQKWMKELRDAILKQLAITPRAFPLAPENEDFEDEIRQLVVGRYRISFTIDRRAVHVLHVRGPYPGRRLDADDK
jgi:plasmid stabilization system protein ParE